MISQDSKRALANPWALAVIGLVVVVLAVNAVLVWMAVHEPSSLVDRGYSVRDRKSNEETVREISARHALGWRTTMRSPGAVAVDLPTPYEIEVVDRAGNPVSGALDMLAYRPADAHRDFAVRFGEVSPGIYRGSISFPLKGWWELRIRIRRGEDMYEAEGGRLSVAPA